MNCKKRTFYEFSTVLSKGGLNVGYLSEITLRTLMLHERTIAVTYCADVMLFLQATSGRLSLSAAFFCRRFHVFYFFKCHLTIKYHLFLL